MARMHSGVVARVPETGHHGRSSNRKQRRTEWIQLPRSRRQHTNYQHYVAYLSNQDVAILTHSYAHNVCIMYPHLPRRQNVNCEAMLPPSHPVLDGGCR